MKNELNRRDFIKKTGMITIGAGLIFSRCAQKPDIYTPPLLDSAPDGQVLTAGLVGCGGRGTGAAINFLDAGPNLQVTALADLFSDKIESTKKALQEQRDVVIPDEMTFIGFDAYQKVVDSGVDIVLFATPPHFRPEHFEYAVSANKHVFLEKPVAVDPVGTRSVMATSRKAETLGLQVSTGTQYRHQRDFVATRQRIAAGDIGEIVSANAYFDVGQLWYREPNDEWSEMEYMLRDWVNWCWLSGDHIVEQHIHNLDTMNWFLNAHPIKAVGFGGRHRRPTGDQYDFFSVDFVYEGDRHLHSMCRQINGTHSNVSNRIVGTQGVTNCRNTVLDHDQNTKWQYEYPEGVESVPWGAGTGEVAVSPYVQEHIDMVTNIRRGTPIVESIEAAESTLTAIMGRVSAYTGKEVTWEEMMNSDIALGPSNYEFGPVGEVEKTIPVPGTA